MLIKEQLSKVACKSTNLTAGQRCNPGTTCPVSSANFHQFQFVQCKKRAPHIKPFGNKHKIDGFNSKAASPSLGQKVYT